MNCRMIDLKLNVCWILFIEFLDMMMAITIATGVRSPL